jgi:hypothetical protein
MKGYQKHVMHWCSIIIVFSILLLLVGCPLWGSPIFDFNIENKTQQVLYISVNSGSGDEVEPGEKITKKFPKDTGKFKIVAKNSKGEIVYSNEFTLGELDDLQNNVVIK